jgi:23S rRNA (adenine2503-C2)-methyltransferase
VKPAFLSLTHDEAREWVRTRGEAPTHAGALRRALLHGADPTQTPNVPRRLIDALEAAFVWLESESIEQHDAPDGSTKHLIRLGDGTLIETVHLPGSRGGAPSACLTSQVGCAMACRFCASGLDKVTRNVAAHEYLEQLVHLRRRGDVQRLVFMGSGEPTQNLRNLAAALPVLRDEARIGPKNTLVSTVGPAAAVDRLGELGLRLTLALSLHASTPELRAALIPTQRKETPAGLLDAADRYSAKVRRPYQVEYVLLRGVNDRDDDAEKLAALLEGRRAHLSLIRWNAVPGMPFETPLFADAQRFTQRLRDAGVSATLRETVGNEAAAACGQLRSSRREART